MLRLCKYLILSTCFTMGIAACTKELDKDASQRYQEKLIDSYRYYPLQIGNSWTYSIDSTYYFDNLGQIEIENVKGIYRETLIDTFRDESNLLVYRCLKEKQLPNQGWTTLRVYSLTRTSSSLIRTEENTPLIDLIFPISQNTNWDPRILIDPNASYLIKGKTIQLFKDWSDSYIEQFTTQTFDGKEHQVIDIVDVLPDDNIILYKSSKRRYAKDIGMISKSQAFFTTQRINQSDKPWKEKADIGFEAEQTLLEYH